MKFKDILVHIDNSPQSAHRLQLAITLAGEHGAHLTGAYIIPHIPYAHQEERMERDEGVTQTLFEQMTGAAGIGAEWLSVDWATVGVSVADMLNYHAHTKDLVIVGQTDSGMPPDEHLPPDLPQRIIVGAGRPVLVVPYTETSSSIGKRVILAWKAGRVSARAVNDALPFLLNAEEVIVMSIVTPGEQQVGVAGSNESICANLERHAIRVREVQIVMERIPVANLLMNYAWENACDMIVTGVYYRKTRWKFDLGPVANDFLQQMTLPVLMSY